MAGSPPENPLESAQADTGERIAELKARVDRGRIMPKISEVEIIKAIQLAKTNFEIIKKETDPEKLKNLVKLTVQPNNKILTGEAQQIYRTEILALANAHFAKNEKENDQTVSDFFEKSLATMNYGNVSVGKSLFDAMRMIQHEDFVPDSVKKSFLNAVSRGKLAQEMEGGADNVSITKGEITIGGKKYTIENFQVLAGAAMMGINPRFLDKFMLQNLIIKNGIVLAQMRNESHNFVAMKISETPPAPPAVPPAVPAAVPAPAPSEVVSAQIYEFNDPGTHAVLAKFNPDNLWVEWTDHFWNLNPAERQVAEIRIKQEMLDKLPEGLRKEIQKMSEKMIDPKTWDEVLAHLKDKTSPDEIALKADLEGKFTEIKDRELLSMFETSLGVRFQEHHLEGAEQEQYKNLQKVIQYLTAEAPKKPENQGKSIDAILTEALAKTDLSTMHPAILTFQDEFTKFKSSSGITDFIGEKTFEGLPKKADAAWIDLAKQYREKANGVWLDFNGNSKEDSRQAQEILQKVLAKYLKSDAKITPEQEQELKKESEKEVTESDIRKALQDRGMLEESFWKGKVIYNPDTKKDETMTTEQQFINTILSQSRASYVEQGRFNLLVAENPSHFDLTDPNIAEAFYQYSDITGEGNYALENGKIVPSLIPNLSDENKKFATKELAINTVLFAISGGTAALALKGVQLAAGATGLLRAGNAMRGTMALRGASLGTGLATAGEFVGTSVVGGGAFGLAEQGTINLLLGKQVNEDLDWDRVRQSMYFYGGFQAANGLVGAIGNRLGGTGAKILNAPPSSMPGIVDATVGVVRAAKGTDSIAKGALAAAQHVAAGEARMTVGSGIMTTLNSTIGDADWDAEQFAKNWYLMHFLALPAKRGGPREGEYIPKEKGKDPKIGREERKGNIVEGEATREKPSVNPKQIPDFITVNINGRNLAFPKKRPDEK